ncbi:MAG: AP-3 complex subunit beta [Geoglossum umbratile]|nr:MAG: AP-3 complex subunit beta [Geoglossum umbratile]
MESLSKISGMLETARDLTLEAAQSAGSASRSFRRDAGKNISSAQIKKLLDSRNDRDILEGLRKVISMMYRSQPCLPFFSSVVKNVASPNIEIKKLVYIYLLHHAEAEPDLALLSINTIQKSLTDQNPQVRAMALKVMSGIRVPVISQIVSLAIKRGCADMSPYVRKAAALAIPKCYRLDPNTLPQLIESLSVLFGDKQYYVIGAAIAALMDVCPERIDLVHGHYRGLIRKLVDMDEWSQLATLRLMTTYARKCFPQRTTKVKKGGSKRFYGDEDEGVEDGEEILLLDPDLELLLNACKPLLQSRNSAVIVAVARCYYYLGTPEYIDAAVGPLTSLLRSPEDIQHIALYNIATMCLACPELFVKYATHFLIRITDPPYIWRLKLEILTIIFPYCGPHMNGVILSELEHFSRGSDRDLVRESVRAIGRCTQSDSRASTRCLRLLLNQISSSDGTLAAESLTVIRHLIQQDPSSHTKTVIRLAKNLDTATNPQARASIIWLVGEFAGVGGENNIAADVLRILAKGFSDESEAAKLQIVLLAAKVYAHYLNRTQAATNVPKTATPEAPVINIGDDGGFSELDLDDRQFGQKEEPTPQVDTIPLLWNYVLLLARYDTSYDLRDRTRLYKALLAVSTSTQLASLILLAPKPVPHTPSPSEWRKDFTLGSASLVVAEDGGLAGLSGYEPLPDWVKEGFEPDRSLRDERTLKTEYTGRRDIPAADRLDSAIREGGKGAHGQGSSWNSTGDAPSGSKAKTLDDWLAEGGSGDEDEDEDEDEEEEEPDEETSEEEESEESDNDADEHDNLVRQ